MAMDALKNLVNNVPDWLQRLDDLSGEIDRRQAELAAIAAAEGRSPETKSLRNKGSTESLKPNDDPPVVYADQADEDILQDSTAEIAANAQAKTPETPEIYTPSPGSIRKQQEAIKIAQARAQAQVRKKGPKRKAEAAIRETNIRKLAKRRGSEDGMNDDEIPLLSSASSSQLSVPHNGGSAETLKPQDEPPVVHTEAPANENIPEDNVEIAAKTPETPKIYTPSPGSIRKQQEAIKIAQARARDQVRKKPKSPSMMSNEDAPAAYRTRTMIIVYYDNYVQGFFDELVRFVSASRNLMRKAKMAARVAQIKKLAEQDVSEDGNDDDALPSLQYMSSRRFGPMSISRSGVGDQPPDVYDNLDKGLEFVQSMCEHGAHQFLRDGDCNDEISKAQKRLGEVLEMAKTEMERVQREEPELAKETGEIGKVRTRRPISMRRDMSVNLKDGSPPATKELEPVKLDPMAPIAVDPEYLRDDADGINVERELPKLQYRSTRAMRSRGP